MKIGIIIGYLGIGGAERVAANLANWLTEQGDTVVFFHTKRPAEKEYPLHPAIVRHVCFAKSKMEIISKMRKCLRLERPDVVLIMSSPMCVYAIPAITGLNIPTVVSERSAPKNARVKKSTRILADRFMKRADAYVFQTNGAKAYFKQSIQARGTVIPNPLDVQGLPKPYAGERTKRFVAMGRLIKEKNYPLLVRAFTEFRRQYPEFTLDIYGDGRERESVQALIEQCGASDCITLHPARDDVLTAVQDAFAFVLSSDLEGMPNALIEAMAIGLPCISTDCPSGGPADLIENRVNGLLVPVDDVPALANAMQELCQDAELRASVSKQAITIRERLAIDVIGKKWREVLASATGGKSRQG